MAFVSEYTDNFARADSTNLGANWNETTTDVQIVSQKLKQVGGGNAEAHYTSVTSLADSYTTFYVEFSTATAGVGIYCRANNGLTAGYIINFKQAGGKRYLDFYRKYASGWGSLGLDFDVSASLTFPATCTTLVTGSGATITVAAYNGETKLHSVNDTHTNRVTTAGRGGIRFNNATDTVTNFVSGTWQIIPVNVSRDGTTWKRGVKIW